MNFFSKYIVHISIILFVGVTIFVSSWLINNPQENYPIPLILYFIPDIIGWYGFFILVGIIAGALSVGAVALLQESLIQYKVKDEWETLIKDNEETLDPFIKTLLTAYKDGHENFEYDEKTYNTSIVLERHINELSNK